MRGFLCVRVCFWIEASGFSFGYENGRGALKGCFELGFVGLDEAVVRRSVGLRKLLSVVSGWPKGGCQRPSGQVV